MKIINKPKEYSLFSGEIVSEIQKKISAAGNPFIKFRLKDEISEYYSVLCFEKDVLNSDIELEEGTVVYIKGELREKEYEEKLYKTIFIKEISNENVFVVDHTAVKLGIDNPEFTTLAKQVVTTADGGVDLTKPPSSYKNNTELNDDVPF